MSDQFFSFVIFVLLARLLTRADIGAFAIMAIFAEVFRTISAAGLIQTVAREPVLTDEFTDTVYRAHMGFSLIACAIVLAVAHPFAAFMGAPQIALPLQRSEEHTSELQYLMRSSYAVFCLKKKN